MNADDRFNLTQIQEELEIDLSDLHLLYSEYLSEMQENLEEASALAAAGDFERLQRVIHNMKGVSANLGVHKVFNTTSLLDGQLKRKEYTESVYMVDKIGAALNAAKIEIIEEFEAYGFLFV